MSNELEQTTSAPLACDLSAIDAQHRDQHLETAQKIFKQVEEVRELPDGYALRLPGDTDTFLQIANFVARERRCCPFLNFALELGAENDPFWLRLTGPEGAKQVLQNELKLRPSEETT